MRSWVVSCNHVVGLGSTRVTTIGKRDAPVPSTYGIAMPAEFHKITSLVSEKTKDSRRREVMTSNKLDLSVCSFYFEVKLRRTHFELRKFEATIMYE